MSKLQLYTHCHQQRLPSFYHGKKALQVQAETRCTLPAAREQAGQTATTEPAANSYARVLAHSQEVAMTRLRIGHCKATKGHIVSRGPPAVCHHCGSTLSREHILLECGTVQELRGEFYEADSLTSLFECVRPLAIIEYLKEAGFFYLIWQVYEYEIRNVKSHKPQNPDYHIIEEDKWIAENIRKMCRTANMSWRTCVVVKQTQSHPIPQPSWPGQSESRP